MLDEEVFREAVDPPVQLLSVEVQDGAARARARRPGSRPATPSDGPGRVPGRPRSRSRSPRAGGSGRRRRSRSDRGPAGAASIACGGAGLAQQVLEMGRVRSTESLVRSGPCQFFSRARSPSAKRSGSTSLTKARPYWRRSSPTSAFGIPAQPAPDHLVDVVVAALGIGDEADRPGLVVAEDRRLALRPAG